MIIYFLPTLLNELLHLLVITSNEDVALNTVRVLIHIVHGVHEAGKNDILHSYVQVFNLLQCLLVNIWYYVIYWFNNFHVSMNKRNLIIVANSFIVSNWTCILIIIINPGKISILIYLHFHFNLRWGERYCFKHSSKLPKLYDTLPCKILLL